ncbi:MAG: caspase family protein [Spirochaetaceae bacterium]|jgi:WD40 repeat protein|nr:caspase family protein [Spirochaetaceae bacterium]
MKHTAKKIITCIFIFFAANIFSEQPVVFPSGWHERVSAVSPSPDGKWLAAGNSGGAIVLYDAESGRELRSFSPAQDEGEGKMGIIKALAWSPDGSRLAAALDSALAQWKAPDGVELKAFGSNLSGIVFLAYSPDGKKIAAAEKDRIIVWDAAKGSVIFETPVTAGAAFAWSADSRSILCASGAGNSAWDEPAIRKFDAATGRQTEAVPWDPGTIEKAAFSPDLKKLALIKKYETGLEIRDTATGQKLLDVSKSDFPINAVSAAFSPDGAYIAAGTSQNGMVVWDASTGEVMIRLIRPYGYEWGGRYLSFTPEGRYLVSEGGSGYGLMRWEWNIYTGPETGYTDNSSNQHYSAVKMSSKGKAGFYKSWDVEAARELRFFTGGNYSAIKLEFSPDSKKLAAYYSNNLVVWDLAGGRQLSSRSQTTQSRISVTGPRTLFSPDGNFAAVPGEGTYTIYRAKRKSAKEYYKERYPDLQIESIEGNEYIDEIEDTPLYTIEAVKPPVFSPDGRYIATIQANSFIMLWDAANGKALARFISYPDDEWIVINSDGYYNASPAGDSHLNVRIDNTVYGIEQFRFMFYRPNAVRLGLGNDQRAYAAAIRTGKVENAASFVPPEILLRQSGASRGLVPLAPAPAPSREFSFSVEVSDKNQPLKSIKVFHNGRRLGNDELAGAEGARGLRVAEAALTTNAKTASFTLTLSLAQGRNAIEVSAFNGYAESKKELIVFFEGDEEIVTLPQLWILAVGVNGYSDSGISSLSYCVNDAREIIETLKNQEGKRYSKVNTLLIADGSSIRPTAANIRKNLGFLKNASSQDMALLFLAGHGVSDSEGNFLFLGADASFTGNGSIDPTGVIGARDIFTVLNSGGNRLVFIDACHSGGLGGNTSAVDADTLVRSLMESNAFVFTSSKSSELSQERAEYSHGVFTFSILRGLNGTAAQGDVVSVMQLGGFVTREVATITNNLQHPLFYALGFGDFDIARIK